MLQFSRRDWLLAGVGGLGALLALPSLWAQTLGDGSAKAQTAPKRMSNPKSNTKSKTDPSVVMAQLATAWQAGLDQHIGLLAVQQTGTMVLNKSVTVPTRAHGLYVQADGAVVAVARRPGDWLLRWQPKTAHTQWHWVSSDRRFNGHAVVSPNGAQLWCTQTDLISGQGLVSVLDALTLEVQDEWTTYGIDPHALWVLPQAWGAMPAGTLIVANGGIAILPETGRSKLMLHRMDSSLVALAPGTGALLGQWRLPDPWLSLRHLAWDAQHNRLGVALQAQHPDATEQHRAPVLAVFDGQTLQLATDQPALAGYGGDIAALPMTWGGGFAVSCPRSDAVALFASNGAWLRNVSHPTAYALASDAAHWWLASGAEGRGVMGAGLESDNLPPFNGEGGVEERKGRLLGDSGATQQGFHVFQWEDADQVATTLQSPLLPTFVLPKLQLDNHWQLYPFQA